MSTNKLIFGSIIGIYAILYQTSALNLSPSQACNLCINRVLEIQNADNSESISNELADQFYHQAINSKMTPHDFCAIVENVCIENMPIVTFGTPDDCRKCQKIANNLISHMAYGRQAIVEHAGEFGCERFKVFQKLSCKLWLVKHKNALIDAILETHNNPHHACIIMHQC